MRLLGRAARFVPQRHWCRGDATKDNVAENNIPGVNFESARRSGRSETLFREDECSVCAEPNTENWEKDANFSNSKGNFDRAGPRFARCFRRIWLYKGELLLVFSPLPKFGSQFRS
jgi:hypothetical protein